MESCLSSSYTKTSVTVCAQSGRRLHGHMRVVEHTPLSNCSANDVLVEATTLLDETLFQEVDVANPDTVDALLEHAPRLIVTGFRSGLVGVHGKGEMKSGV